MHIPPFPRSKVVHSPRVSESAEAIHGTLMLSLPLFALLSFGTLIISVSSSHIDIGYIWSSVLVSNSLIERKTWTHQYSLYSPIQHKQAYQPLSPFIYLSFLTPLYEQDNKTSLQEWTPISDRASYPPYFSSYTISRCRIYVYDVLALLTVKLLFWKYSWYRRDGGDFQENCFAY